MNPGELYILLDWGDTVMRDLHDFQRPMYLWPKVQAVTGIRDALSLIRQTRTIVLATNAVDSEAHEIWKALKRAGLDRMFDKVYCFRSVGHRKPSREFFAYILQDLQIDASHVVMIGGSFETDVLGANRCGIYGIWFNEKSDERRCGSLYTTIHELSELPEIITKYEDRVAT